MKVNEKLQRLHRVFNTVKQNSIITFPLQALLNNKTFPLQKLLNSISIIFPLQVLLNSIITFPLQALLNSITFPPQALRRELLLYDCNSISCSLIYGQDELLDHRFRVIR